MPSYDPADNRFRVNPNLLPLVEAYRKRHSLDTKTTAINSMIIKATEADHGEKPHTTNQSRS